MLERGAVGVRLSRRRGTSVTQPPPQFGGPNPIDGPANPAPQYDGPQFGGPAPVGAPQPDPHGPPPNFVQSPQQPGWPNQFGGQPQQYQQFGQPPAAPQQNRKALIVTGVATGVVLLVVAIVVGIVSFSGGGDGETRPAGGAATAEAAVKGYLEALSKGDAEAALSYSADQPASKEFLTDDILKKQIAQWPVGNIRILNSEDMGGVMARVHVAANFGDQTSDETILVKKTDGSWKLSTAAVKLSLDQNGILAGALRTLSLFGKPASNMSVAYVFPGWLDIGSANKNLTAVSARPVLLNGILVQGAPVFPGIEMRMSEEGAAAVKKAVVDNIAECAKSTSLALPGCPQALRNPAYVDGTARWEPPSDVDKVQYTFTAFDLTVRTTGVTTWMLTVQSTNGSTVQGRAIVPTMGQIDMTQDPLVVKWFGR